MGECVEHRLVDALGLELIEVRDGRASALVPGDHGLVESAVPRRHRLGGFGGQFDVTLGQRGERVATEARDLNETVYECIGLSEPKRVRVVDLLAELRASGNEFDVEQSDEVIEEVGSPHTKKRGRSGRSEVA
jgi:hypothetical protein